MGSVRGWIEGDESAKEMLARVLIERPFLLLPPLDRVPLRAGNVVEIVGPSPSAKSHILIQAAISCILPKDWNGVHYGGLERSVMFVDLDCRFDILRFAKCLKHRINPAYGLEKNEADDVNLIPKKISPDGSNEELYHICLRRFLYVRCHNSLDFLAALKTLHYQLLKQRKTDGVGVYLLIIDSHDDIINIKINCLKSSRKKSSHLNCVFISTSIGAFYWTDRALTSLPLGAPNRRSLSLQTVSRTVVQELQRLLQVQPMLVLATKAANLQDKFFKTQLKSDEWKWPSQNGLCFGNVKIDPQNLPYREYMPSVWQDFVTYRILVRATENEMEHQNHPTFISEWLLPLLNITDKFIVRNNGIFIVG